MGFLDNAKKAALKAKEEAQKAGNTVKLKGEIALKERKANTRKQQFGVEFYDQVRKNDPSNPSSIFKGEWAPVKKPFDRAHSAILDNEKERAVFQQKLDKHQAKDNDSAGDVLKNSANATKYSSQIAILDQKIKSRKEGFGMEIWVMNLSSSGLPPDVQACLKSAQDDIRVIEGKIQAKHAKISGGSAHSSNSKPTATAAATPAKQRPARSKSPAPAQKIATANPAKQRPGRSKSPVPAQKTATATTAKQRPGRSKSPVPAQKVGGGRSDTAKNRASKSRSRSRDPAKQKEGEPVTAVPAKKGKRAGRSPAPPKKTATATPVVATAGPAAAPAPVPAKKPVAAVPVKATPVKKATPAKKTSNDDPAAALLGAFGLTAGDVQAKFAQMGLVEDDDDSPYGNPYGGAAKPTKGGTPVQAFAVSDESDEEEIELDPRWKLGELKFNGKSKSTKKGKAEKVRGPIPQGIRKFKRHPEKYVAIYYQSEMLEWDDVMKHKYTLIHRPGTVYWRPADVTPEGILDLFWYTYERCTPFKFDMFPREHRDQFTDNLSFHGRKLHSENRKPVMPGRGMGCGDIPELKIMGKVGPQDIIQGSVGNCWLLSSISALAEFPGSIRKIFRKNKNIANMPTDSPNTYTVTLWDLKSWKEVDIEIDERLCANPDPKKLLLGAKPGPDGSLWGPYLEKALVAHVGGWDKLEGGQPAHAFSLLTGTKNNYTIKINEKNGKFKCLGQFDDKANKWAAQCNSPHDTCKKFWPMPWPKVGGGGGGDITKDELFMKMVAWDQEDFVVVAWTTGESDSNTTDGLVDIHAYSVIESIHKAAGTNIDLLKVRNPWGKGEMERGQFSDGGPGWEEYPEIKELIKPVSRDDGIFWMTKQEFFVHFKNVCVCATSMSQYSEE